MVFRDVQQVEEEAIHLEGTGGTRFRCRGGDAGRMDVFPHPADLTVTELSHAAQEGCRGPYSVVPQAGDQTGWY